MESTPIGAIMSDPKTLTIPTDSSKRKEKARKEYVPEDLESDPSSPDSSSRKYDLSDDIKYSESKIKRRNERKNNCKHKKHDLSELFSIDSAFFDDSEYIRKRHNKNSHRKKDPIKLCPRLTEKLLTTAYKSKIIRFKMDEDPLQRRIQFSHL